MVDNGVHDQSLPAGFSITPYRDGSSAAGEAAVRSRLDRFRIGARLLAAGLAGTAAWTEVLVATTWLPGDNGNPHGGGFIRYSFNGWGHAAVTTSPSVDFDVTPINGPDFGVLLCVAAAVLLLAATTGWWPGWLRWQPSGRMLAALAAAFLLAIVLCEVLAAAPYRTAGSLNADFRAGLSPWLAAAGWLLAALSCLPWSVAAPQPVADRRSW